MLLIMAFLLLVIAADQGKHSRLFVRGAHRAGSPTSQEVKRTTRVPFPTLTLEAETGLSRGGWPVQKWTVRAAGQTFCTLASLHALAAQRCPAACHFYELRGGLAAC